MNGRCCAILDYLCPVLKINTRFVQSGDMFIVNNHLKLRKPETTLGNRQEAMIAFLWSSLVRKRIKCVVISSPYVVQNIAFAA